MDLKNAFETAKFGFDNASSYQRLRRHQALASTFVRLLLITGLAIILGAIFYSLLGTPTLSIREDQYLWATKAAKGTLRQRLAEAVPYDPNARWNRNIIQSWRDPLDETAEYRSWEEFKRDFNHIFLIDPAQEQVVRNFSANNLHDIEFAYINLLNKAVLQADFFRYMVVFAFGGIWADADTWLRRPFDEWISMASVGAKTCNIAKLERKVGMIVGIEYEHSQTLVQYVFAAKQGHPVLLELIAGIIELSPELAIKVDKNQLGIGDILRGTGPSRFSEVVAQWIRTRWDDKFDREQEWNELRTPTLFGDILVLPQYGFGGNQPYRPNSHDDKPGSHDDRTCVQHSYQNSWSNDHD